MDLPKRVSLARLPTPIHALRGFAKGGVKPWIWRDDLTGCVLSGNKVRKLEFLLAEAVDQGATAVVTCGGMQSNHVRATTFAARRLGLGVSVVLRVSPEGTLPPPMLNANHLLDRIAGARVREVPFVEFEAAGKVYDPFLGEEAARLRAQGHRVYSVPEGGSNPLGSFGYVRAVEEMLATWRESGPGTKAPDALFLALGSGGTHAGLVLGFERAGLDPETVHAVNVCDDEAYFQRRVGELIRATVDRYGLSWSGAPLRIHDGHVGAGYGQASEEDLRFYVEFASREGIPLDPCYTGKAFRGMLAELEKSPGAFGDHVLFLHSGGIYENFAYADQYARVFR